MGTKAKEELMSAVFSHFNAPECDLNWLASAFSAKPRDAKRLHTSAKRYLADPSDTNRGRLLKDLLDASEKA